MNVSVTVEGVGAGVGAGVGRGVGAGVGAVADRGADDRKPLSAVFQWLARYEPDRGLVSK